MKTMKTMKTTIAVAIFLFANWTYAQVSSKGVDYSCINGSTAAIIAVGGESQEYIMSQVPFKIKSNYGGSGQGGYLEVSGNKTGGGDRNMYHCDDNNSFFKSQDCNNNFIEYNVYTNQKILKEYSTNWVFMKVQSSNCPRADSEIKYGLNRINNVVGGGYNGYSTDINYGDVICVANIYGNTFNWLAWNWGGAAGSVGTSSARTQAFSSNCYEKPSYKQFPMWTIFSASGKTGKVKYGDDFYLASGVVQKDLTNMSSLLQVNSTAGSGYNTSTTTPFFHKMDNTESFKAIKTSQIPSGIEQSRAAR
jgi:hypothetical protein